MGLGADVGRFSLVKRFRLTRDSILFVFGLGGIIYETVVTNIERPTLLILFAGMAGLPVFLRTDEKRVPASELKEVSVSEETEPKG